VTPFFRRILSAEKARNISLISADFFCDAAQSHPLILVEKIAFSY